MFTPDNYKLVYSLDEVKKTFAQFNLLTAEKPLLPELIRLEKNNGYNSITGADNLLRIQNAKNWTKCALSGLRPTGTPNFYYADLPVKTIKSLCVVYLSNERDKIEIRVFPQFYPYVKPELFALVENTIKNF